MNPKSGSAGNAVSPSAPKVAEKADDADPGEASKAKARELETRTGKYGSIFIKPHKPLPSDEDKEKKPHWIELVMTDEANQPVVGEAYRVTLPDETVAEGSLDEKGFARIDGIEPGSCKVTFPNLDKEAWDDA